MNKYLYNDLRLVLFAGEVFPVKKFLALKKIWPTKEYYNLYGPTETNVCTYYKIPESLNDISVFAIGKCCPHYNYMITEGGELCIKGSGLMCGYWQSEELNRISFLTDKNGDEWYRTGDLVETGKEENLFFKGRMDRMVKRHGYRIELREIEDVLGSHPGIIENAVISTIDKENDTVISAFVSCSSSSDESLIKMKNFCMQHLPVYMIPDNFIFLKTLPQTASNKTDYQQLKQMCNGF